LVGCWLGDQTTTTEKMNSSKPQWEQVGEAFVQHYYNTFDSSRSNLGPLYRENSMLTFEGEKYLGVQQIVGKLTVSWQFSIFIDLSIDGRGIVSPEYRHCHFKKYNIR